MSTALIVLAAGRGTRMNSELPKVLHLLAGAPLLAHVLKSGRALNPERVVVVAGYGADQVTKAVACIDPRASVVIQAEQLGTGHAVAQALPALADFEGRVVILYADTPFIRPETLEALVQSRADVTVLGFEAADPGRYGRLIVRDGVLEAIVEFKDASIEERALTLCNSGLIGCDAKLLSDLVKGLSNDNASSEYYLTDIVAAARARGLSTAVVTCPEAETLGINTQSELSHAEALHQSRMRAEALEGVMTLT